jgi:hypothetical protein
MMATLHEPVEVCAHFGRDRIHPLWFIWNGRHYKVAAVTSRWVSAEGLSRRYHFAVLAEQAAEAFELYLRTENLRWYLGHLSGDG